MKELFSKMRMLRRTVKELGGWRGGEGDILWSSCSQGGFAEFVAVLQVRNTVFSLCSKLHGLVCSEVLITFQLGVLKSSIKLLLKTELVLAIF